VNLRAYLSPEWLPATIFIIIVWTVVIVASIAIGIRNRRREKRRTK